MICKFLGSPSTLPWRKIVIETVIEQSLYELKKDTGVETDLYLANRDVLSNENDLFSLVSMPFYIVWYLLHSLDKEMFNKFISLILKIIQI